ncbi:hypothetical protein KKA85_12340, partial [bacterium]|nr:hypothetical protein [bacterium]
SDDGGANWIYEYSLHEPAGVKYFPSIAIGEGVNDRLLIAYETARNTADARVVVFWRDLDTGGTGTVTVDTYPGNIVGRPKICVDSPEYSVWYAYLTYVRGLAGVGDYQLWFSRSLAYGETWETPMLRSLSVNYEDDHAIDFGSAGLLCAWSEKSISANIHATWSADFGATWGAPTLLASSALDEFEPSVAVSNVDDTAVVIFAVDYGGMDTDIEACVTTNGGGAWSRVYLPYNGEYELGSNLTFDPVTNTINAAYGRAKGVITTSAGHLTPATWSPALRVNEQQSAAYIARRAIAADPTGTHGVGIAWMDDRDPDKYGVYFDASNVVNPRAVEYLVICPDALIDPAGVLAHYRELRGYGVHLVTLSQIGPAPLGAADIDQFIEEYAAASPQLRFLTLIGDVDLLPGFYVDDGSAQWYSDLRYADTDGSFAVDYSPDIAVGRIPVRDAGELWDYVAKVKAFELVHQTRNKVIFFGSQPEMGYVATRDSAEIADLGYDVGTLYDPSETQLFASLNDPAVAMVLYYGHGSFATNWPLHLGNLDLWTNEDRPVLYFSGGCEFNDNTIVDPPLGHELLFSPGCAAIATGATVNGGYGYAYEYIHILLRDSWLYKTMGELHRHALISHRDHAAAMGQDVSLGSWVQFFTGRMMCHGDPALRIDGDVTAVPEAAPGAPRLSQNHPNPFNPRTTIRFELPARAAVGLRIYDLEGRLVRALLDGAPRDAGPHEVVWDGRDAHGADAPSGVYMYRLATGRGTLTGKMALLR